MYFTSARTVIILTMMVNLQQHSHSVWGGWGVGGRLAIIGALGRGGSDSLRDGSTVGGESSRDGGGVTARGVSRGSRCATSLGGAPDCDWLLGRRWQAAAFSAALFPPPPPSSRSAHQKVSFLREGGLSHLPLPLRRLNCSLPSARGKRAGQLAAFLNLINVHTDLVHSCTETLVYSQRGFEGGPREPGQSGISVSSRPAAL